MSNSFLTLKIKPLLILNNLNPNLVKDSASTHESGRTQGQCKILLSFHIKVYLQYRFIGTLNNLIMPFHIYWNIRSDFLFVSYHNML